MIITPDGAGATFGAGVPTVWHHDSFAEAWLRDAKREALDPDPNARRREIVFAAAFAESFFFEWIRDRVITPRRWDKLESYFSRHLGIVDRWRTLEKRLHEEGFIPSLQVFQGTVWQEFCLMVRRRDAYLHASASMPEQPNQSQVGAISTSKGTHRNISPAWATSAAVAQARALVADCGMEVPSWLAGD